MHQKNSATDRIGKVDQNLTNERNLVEQFPAL